MKATKFILLPLMLVLISIGGIGCKGKPDQGEPVDPNMPKTEMLFGEDSFDFGSIPQGVPVQHEFTFTNIGENDLKLGEVKAGCHCTSPKWTKDLIKPGGKGSVIIEFDAKAVGKFKKAVIITANTLSDRHILRFTGEVLED